MICVTGDLHGDMTRFKAPELRKLKRGDALIITGDFGCIWSGDKKEQRILKRLGRKKYYVLFVDGVHENFDLLEKYPVEEFCGGVARHISGNLYQLMRGEYYTIAGKDIFTFGGGQSEDITSGNEERWLKEMPNDDELIHGIEKLKEHDNRADFIITYEPPAQLIEFIDIGTINRNHINTYLDGVLKKIDFEMWYFGKRHINKLIPPRYHCLFDKVIFADKTKLPKVKRVKK